jgi:hypothetical protein
MLLGSYCPDYYSVAGRESSSGAACWALAAATDTHVASHQFSIRRQQHGAAAAHRVLAAGDGAPRAVLF